jgi:ATP-binding cassette subfamily B protein
MARNLETLQKQYNSTAAANTRGPMAATNNFKGKPAHSRDTVRRILTYVGKYKFRLVLVVLCMLLSTGASLAAGYVLRPVINRMPTPPRPPRIAWPTWRRCWA